MKPAPHADAVDFLQAEHARLRELFARWHALPPDRSARRERRQLADRICMALTIHGRLEQELLDPVVLTLEDDSLLDEAEIAHEDQRDLVAQLLATSPGDVLFDARMAVLIEHAQCHLRDEELHVLAALRQASGLDLAALGARMRERRSELEAVADALREDAIAGATA